MATHCAEDKIRLKDSLEKSNDFKPFLENDKIRHLYRFNNSAIFDSPIDNNKYDWDMSMENIKKFIDKFLLKVSPTHLLATKKT